LRKPLPCLELSPKRCAVEQPRSIKDPAWIRCLVLWIVGTQPHRRGPHYRRGGSPLRDFQGFGRSRNPHCRDTLGHLGCALPRRPRRYILPCLEPVVIHAIDIEQGDQASRIKYCAVYVAGTVSTAAPTCPRGWTDPAPHRVHKSGSYRLDCGVQHTTSERLP